MDDGQKSDTKAYQADKSTKDNQVPKGDRNLDAWIRLVNDERCTAYSVRSQQSQKDRNSECQEVIRGLSRTACQSMRRSEYFSTSIEDICSDVNY